MCVTFHIAKSTVFSKPTLPSENLNFASFRISVQTPFYDALALGVFANCVDMHFPTRITKLTETSLIKLADGLVGIFSHSQGQLR